MTTRAIARESGLTQPAIYRHFAAKEDLVREVLTEIRRLFIERLEALPTTGSASERLFATLDVFRDFAVEEPRLYDALFLRPGQPVRLASSPQDRGANIFSTIVERVAECSRDGGLKTDGPVSAALSFAAQSQGLILLYRQGRFPSPQRFATFYRASLENLLRGMQ